MLADDFFRLAHDDVTGRLRLSHRTISVGLAAALLGELLALRRVQIAASGDVRIIDRTPPEDAVAHMVLECLVLEPRSRGPCWSGWTGWRSRRTPMSLAA